MSSQLGIKGYDPVKNTEYILLATDSQSTIKDENEEIVDIGYNAKKIINPKDKSTIISYTGLNLTQENVNYPKKIKKNLESLMNSKNLSKDKIEKIFQEINEETSKLDGDNTAIIGKNEEDLNLLAYDINGLSEPILFSSGGTGMEYLTPFVGNRIKKMDMANKGVILPIEEAMILAMQGINYTAKYDEMTGGNFNFAILTPNKRINISNFGKIDESKGFRDIEKLYKKLEKEKLKDLIFA